MANPNPDLSNLKPFKSLDGGTGRSKQVSVRVPSDLATALEKVPQKQRTDWLRAAIAAKAESEGLI